jgi:glycerol-3-phosphate cytidylyltransferase
MIYCFDIDGTLCETEGNNYASAVPYPCAVKEVQRLYNEGHTIQMFTARGTTSKIDWTDLTRDQLDEWGVPYDELIMNVKPSFDIVVDDRAINALEWRSRLAPSVGFVAGAFDLIHPGYILMFKDAKTVCDRLIVGLQTDPTIDRPEKDPPVQSTADRKLILSSLRYVDEVVEYTTEKDLYNLLNSISIDVRILGTDYVDKVINGGDLNIPIHFHQRNHAWSTSGLKKLIKESLEDKE